MDKKIIAIAGPTAVGKTEYSLRIAEILGGEIVSCDSMQLYKFMDIGSAKPSPAELARVKHYLIGDIHPAESFSAARYQKLAKDAIAQIFAKGKIPVITGGTGLYLNSLLYDMDFAVPPRGDGNRKELEQQAQTEAGRESIFRQLEEIDPEAAKRIHPNNIKRVIRALEAAEERGGEGIRPFDGIKSRCGDYDVLLIGLAREREELYDRINKRVDILMDAGLCEEVKKLIDMGFTSDDISMKGIGYKELIDHFNGDYDLPRAVELIKRNSRHYAKRQMTWFRRYEDMKWFDLSAYDSSEEALGDIISWIEKNL